PRTDRVVKASRLHDHRGKVKFVSKLLIPLLPQICWPNHKELALALGPALRQQKASLDGFSKPDFVGQDCATRKRVSEREQRGFDLVRVKIDLGVSENASEHLHAVRRTSLGKLVREVFCMEIREIH